VSGHRVSLILIATLLVADVAAAQTTGAAAARSGSELYRAACVSCHGPDGTGAPRSQVGFDTPLPDFTDCKFATPEPDGDWAATIHLGGRARAFDHKMPAFADALSDDEIERLIGYLREFCTDRGWPRGDLNLPRPLVTEKAFPENEAVLTTTIAGSHPGSVGNQFVFEHRIGRRGQYEVVVPIDFQQSDAGNWGRGLGDVAVAFKYALFDNLRAGSIFSAGGEVTFPTGKEQQGLGGGTTILEPFGAFSQILPHDGFLHIHAGFELATNHDRANDESYLRVAAGKTFTHAVWGRAWSPMVEVLGAKEMADGEKTQWDLMPQMQVTLSRRQHIMASAGVRFPLNERQDRGTSIVTYFLWDWFDGGLFEGWR
jgi:mono/diheme cytochrome c family protein